jgi:hypothetical protein
MKNKCYLCRKPINKEGKLKFCKKCDKRIAGKLPLFIHCKPTEENLNGIIKMVADVIKKRDKRMFKLGKPIKSMDTLVKKLQNNEWVIIRYGRGRDKPIHPGWLISMQFKTVLQFLQNNRICEAKYNRRAKQ